MEKQTEFLNALYAENSFPELSKELELFGQFVGEWEFEWIGHDPNYKVKYEKGEWIFSWILEGRAIQDVWIIPERNRRHIQGLPKGEYGTTIRFFNVKSNAWNVVWVGPVNGNLRTFEAHKVNGEIVIEQTNNIKGLSRWIFSDIEPNKFHWRFVQSIDNGETWHLIEEMNVTRKTLNR